jgi:methionine sulfoxide reductase catalytic subunit
MATYAETDISPFLWPNRHLPDSEEYRRLRAGNWADYSRGRRRHGGPARPGRAAARGEVGRLLLVRRGKPPGTGLYYDCYKIDHMRRELSILAYEMNGEPLSELHGAPLRLRNEAELGFTQVKWVKAVEFVETFEHLGAVQGGDDEDHQFFGYRMPI